MARKRRPDRHPHLALWTRFAPRGNVDTANGRIGASGSTPSPLHMIV